MDTIIIIQNPRTNLIKEIKSSQYNKQQIDKIIQFYNKIRWNVKSKSATKNSGS